MKRTACFLAICAAIAGAVILLSRPAKPREDTASSPTAGETESPNSRERPARESEFSFLEDDSSANAEEDLAASQNPREAITQAVSRLEEPELSLALAELLGTWAGTDPLAALAWVDSSGREDAADLRAHVLFTWADKAPTAVASWLEENPGMQQPTNLLALLGPWMEQSPEAAVAWSTTKIETIQREGILADLLSSCASEENALALLGEVDPVVADHALQAAVTSLADEQPELAKKLATLITGPVNSLEEKPAIDSVSPGTPGIEPSGPEDGN